MKLSENFSLEELTKSETALRFDLDNTPNDEQLSNLVALCESVLQPIRNHFGKPVKVNSGFRDVVVNAKVGGSSKSDHCKGMAADIEIPSVPNAELAQFIVDSGMAFRQCILEFYTPGIPDSGWVHVSYDIADNKRQVLTATKQNGRTVYLPGLVP